ncbi:MAG: hypothetical protein QXS19_07695 [Candidatus Methanomethylicia archaeon]|jgi:hypothetical protein
MPNLQEEILNTAEQVANLIISIVSDFSNATWSPDQIVYFPQISGKKPPEKWTAVVDLIGFRIQNAPFFRTLHIEPSHIFARDKTLKEKEEVIYTVSVLTPIRLLIFLTIEFNILNAKISINNAGHIAGRLYTIRPEMLVKARLLDISYSVDVTISSENPKLIIPINIVKDVLVPYQTDYRIDGTVGKVEIK